MEGALTTESTGETSATSMSMTSSTNEEDAVSGVCGAPWKLTIACTSPACQSVTPMWESCAGYSSPAIAVDNTVFASIYAETIQVIQIAIDGQSEVVFSENITSPVLELNRTAVNFSVFGQNSDLRVISLRVKEH